MLDIQHMAFLFQQHVSIAITDHDETCTLFISHQSLYNVQFFCESYKQPSCNVMVGRFSPFLQAMKALRVSRVIAVLFLGSQHQMRVGGLALATSTPGKDPVPIVQEAGWAQGLVWTGAENLAPHRDSIPRPSSPQPVAIPTTLPNFHIM